MLDAHVSLPKAFQDALLARLDRLLALLEYHVQPPTAQDLVPPGPRLPQERRYFAVDDRTLWAHEVAVKRLDARGVGVSQKAIEREMEEMRKEGVL